MCFTVLGRRCALFLFSPSLSLTCQNHNIGFVVVDGEGVFYKWDEAVDYCQNEFAKPLYTVNSALKQSKVEELATEKGVNIKAWVGLTDDISPYQMWVWVDGQNTNGYSNWRQGNPAADAQRTKTALRLDRTGATYGQWDPTNKIVNNVGAIVCRGSRKHSLSSSLACLCALWFM